MMEEPRMPLLNGEIRLEDLLIKFEWLRDNFWYVELADVVKGDSAVRIWSNDEIAAVLALGVGGDEIKFSEAAYAIAERAVEDIPFNLRPIP